MELTKEIKERLKAISYLLKEIEDILCKQNDDNGDSSEEPSCTCNCGKESNPDILLAKFNHAKDNCYKNVEKKSPLPKCSKERVKCKGIDKISNDSCDDADTDTICPTKNYKINQDKDNIHQDVWCNNNIPKKQVNNTPKDCSHENFKRKLNDIRQRFMAHFEELNKDETNNCC